MDIQHIRHRAALLELQLDIDRVQAMTERRLRDIRAPAPPERARLCHLPACRRHGACRSDRIRRACALAPGARMEPFAAQPPDQPDDEPPVQPTAPEADRPGSACPEPAAAPEPQSPAPAPPPPAPPRDADPGEAAGEQGCCPGNFRPAADWALPPAPSDTPAFGDPLPGSGAPFEAEANFVPPARIRPPLPRLRILD